MMHICCQKKLSAMVEQSMWCCDDTYFDTWGTERTREKSTLVLLLPCVV